MVESFQESRGFSHERFKRVALIHYSSILTINGGDSVSLQSEIERYLQKNYIEKILKLEN